MPSERFSLLRVYFDNIKKKSSHVRRTWKTTLVWMRATYQLYVSFSAFPNWSWRLFCILQQDPFKKFTSVSKGKKSGSFSPPPRLLVLMIIPQDIELRKLPTESFLKPIALKINIEIHRIMTYKFSLLKKVKFQEFSSNQFAGLIISRKSETNDS